MARPQESSVLFSLAELREIEQDRIEAEEAERQAAIEAERQASVEAEQRAAREAAERRAQAEAAAREAAEREAAERRREQLALEESERKARIEAEAHLAQVRLAREMEVRRIEAEKARPLGLKLLAVALVTVAVALGVVLYNKAREASERAEQLAATRAEISELQTELRGLIDEREQVFEEKLAAKTKADKAAADAKLAEIQKKIDERNAALDRIQDSRDRPRPTSNATARPPRPPPTSIRNNLGCDPNKDPLCGIDP